MKRIMLRLLLFGAMLIAFTNVNVVEAQERVGVGYSWVDDGGCPNTMQALTFEYDRSGEELDTHGMVRSAPSGSDCTQAALSYDVGVSRYFPVGGVDVIVEFGADRQSAMANYDLLHEDGTLQRRAADGNALMTVPLPAGATTTIIGSVGLSHGVGPLRVSGGFNFAPADWATTIGVVPGRTARFGADFDWQGLYADLEIDVGRPDRHYTSFGGIQGGYRWAVGDRSDISIGIIHRWGLNALDNGAPDTQMFHGAEFLRSSAPRNHATFLNVTIGYSLGD